MSVATEQLYWQGERGARLAVQALVEAGLQWLGLSLQQQALLELGGHKVGVLAFCAVQGECMESGSLPFAPVKYSSKFASTAISQLRSVGPYSL